MKYIAIPKRTNSWNLYFKPGPHITNSSFTTPFPVNNFAHPTNMINQWHFDMLKPFHSHP